MTSKGIAKRLIAKWGQSGAVSLGLLMAQSARDKLNQTPAQDSRTSAKYLTRSMFWLAVLHHVQQH